MKQKAWWTNNIVKCNSNTHVGANGENKTVSVRSCEMLTEIKTLINSHHNNNNNNKDFILRE